MIFRTIKKDELKKLFEIMAARNRIVGPVTTGIDANKQPVYAFSDVTEFSKLKLDYTTTKLPAKRFFLPFQEDLATFSIEGDQWEKKVDYNVEGPADFVRSAPLRHKRS